MNNTNVEDRLSDIENKLITIDNKLDSLLEVINNDIKKDCSKMNLHINFIEQIYDKVKNPLGYFIYSNNSKNYIEN